MRDFPSHEEMVLFALSFRNPDREGRSGHGLTAMQKQKLQLLDAIEEHDVHSDTVRRLVYRFLVGLLRVDPNLFYAAWRQEGRAQSAKAIAFCDWVEGTVHGEEWLRGD